jgi:hypothetical protein
MVNYFKNLLTSFSFFYLKKKTHVTVQLMNANMNELTLI